MTARRGFSDDVAGFDDFALAGSAQYLIHRLLEFAPSGDAEE
jgi:hypothetical protein